MTPFESLKLALSLVLVWALFLLFLWAFRVEDPESNLLWMNKNLADTCVESGGDPQYIPKTVDGVIQQWYVECRE